MSLTHTRILTKVTPRRVKVNTVTGNTTEDFTDHSLHIISRFTLMYGFYICIYGTTNYSSSFSNGQNEALTSSFNPNLIKHFILPVR